MQQRSAWAVPVTVRRLSDGRPFAANSGETSLYEERLVDILVENFGRWERGEDFVHRIC